MNIRYTRGRFPKLLRYIDRSLACPELVATSLPQSKSIDDFSSLASRHSHKDSLHFVFSLPPKYTLSIQQWRESLDAALALLFPRRNLLLNGALLAYPYLAARHQNTWCDHVHLAILQHPPLQRPLKFRDGHGYKALRSAEKAGWDIHFKNPYIPPQPPGWKHFPLAYRDSVQVYSNRWRKAKNKNQRDGIDFPKFNPPYIHQIFNKLNNALSTSPIPKSFKVLFSKNDLELKFQDNLLAFTLKTQWPNILEHTSSPKDKTHKLSKAALEVLNFHLDQKPSQPDLEIQKILEGELPVDTPDKVKSFYQDLEEAYQFALNPEPKPEAWDEQISEEVRAIEDERPLPECDLLNVSGPSIFRSINNNRRPIEVRKEIESANTVGLIPVDIRGLEWEELLERIRKKKRKLENELNAIKLELEETIPESYIVTNESLAEKFENWRHFSPQNAEKIIQKAEEKVQSIDNVQATEWWHSFLEDLEMAKKKRMAIEQDRLSRKAPEKEAIPLPYTLENVKVELLNLLKSSKLPTDPTWNELAKHLVKTKISDPDSVDQALQMIEEKISRRADIEMTEHWDDFKKEVNDLFEIHTENQREKDSKSEGDMEI